MSCQKRRQECLGAVLLAIVLTVAGVAVLPPARAADTPPTSAVGPSPARPAAVSEEVQRQYKLALSLYEEMAAADHWQLDLFITNHTRVIEECPKTPMAVESCWRLSNLYLTGRHDPDRLAVIRLMEHALRTYPKNPWRDRFVRRLVTVLQDAGEYQKLLEFCEKCLVAPDLAPERKPSFHLRAGLAAEQLGQAALAASHFQQVLSQDQGRDSLSAGIARQHLSAVTGAPGHDDTTKR